jgi:hypothetical protein
MVLVQLKVVFSSWKISVIAKDIDFSIYEHFSIRLELRAERFVPFANIADLFRISGITSCGIDKANTGTRVGISVGNKGAYCVIKKCSDTNIEVLWIDLYVHSAILMHSYASYL